MLSFIYLFFIFSHGAVLNEFAPWGQPSSAVTSWGERSMEMTWAVACASQIPEAQVQAVMTGLSERSLKIEVPLKLVQGTGENDLKFSTYRCTCWFYLVFGLLFFLGAYWSPNLIVVPSLPINKKFKYIIIIPFKDDRWNYTFPLNYLLKWYLPSYLQQLGELGW